MDHNHSSLVTSLLVSHLLDFPASHPYNYITTLALFISCPTHKPMSLFVWNQASASTVLSPFTTAFFSRHRLSFNFSSFVEGACLLLHVSSLFSCRYSASPAQTMSTNLVSSPSLFYLLCQRWLFHMLPVKTFFLLDVLCFINLLTLLSCLSLLCFHLLICSPCC